MAGEGRRPSRWALAGGQHQLAQHLLEGLVAQGEAVEQLGGTGAEELGAQPEELQVELLGKTGDVGVVKEHLLCGVLLMVSLVDQLEPGGERPVG